MTDLREAGETAPSETGKRKMSRKEKRQQAAAAAAQGGAALVEQFVPPQDRASRSAKVVTVFAPKGGAGKTTVSTNLAVVLNGQGHNKVCLIDIDVEFGDVAIALKIAPTNTILDFIQALPNTNLDQRRENAITHFVPNLDCILAPVSPADSEFVTARAVRELIDNLRPHYDFIVVDTPPHLGEHVLEAMDMADAHVVLTTPEVTALKNLRLALDMFDLLGYDRSLRWVVFNKADKQIGLTAEDSSKVLGLPIAVQVPSSSDIPTSVNRGVPIALSHPDHPVSASIRALAEASVTHGPIVPEQAGGRRRFTLRMRQK
jgi:pilus assembly protein CpaE